MATVPAPALDVDAVRRRFPALSREVAGRPAAYLDGPGGTQVPDSVVEAMAASLRDANANVGGAFATSAEAEAQVERTRAAAADFVGGESGEIVLGANMTSLNFSLSRAAARECRPGDEVLTTTLDHDANISPWLLAARDFGLRVRRVGVRPDLTLDLADLEAQLTERTRVVAYTLASNAVGTVTDAARVAELAHAAGALAWVDGVHFAAHRRIDVGRLGCDVLLCSPYKFFGPHAGLAWARRPLLEGWPADRVRPAAESPPGHRFETGTAAHEALAGVEAAVDYLASLGEGTQRGERLTSAYERIGAHEGELGRRLLDGLEALPGVTVHGIADAARMDERVPTVALTAEGMPPRALAEGLGEEGIFAWDGNYYALALMEHLGLEGRGGALRLGLVHYTTRDEVDRVLEALSRLTAGSRRG